MQRVCARTPLFGIGVLGVTLVAANALAQDPPPSDASTRPSDVQTPPAGEAEPQPQPPPTSEKRPAQAPSEPPTPAALPGHEEHAGRAPSANAEGLQLAFRTGFMVPFGSNATDVYGWQLPAIVEIGAKVFRYLFLGAYAGAGVGVSGGDFAKFCDTTSAGCVATTLRLGLEIQLHLRPADKTNPWIGYGFGMEWTSVRGHVNGDTIAHANRGLELAHVMGGLDFRFNETIGVGPLVDVAIGRYAHSTSEGEAGTLERDIDPPVHVWVFSGGRVVVFP